MRRLLVLLALLPAFLAGAPPASSGEAPPSPAAIDTAIERGVAWLLDERKSDRTWGDVGPTALVLFTLVDAGLPPDHRALSSRAVRRRIRSRNVDRTYDASLLVLLGRDAPELVPAAEMRTLVGLLEGGQSRNGQWSYELDRVRDAGDNSNAQFAVLALGAAVGEGIAVEPVVLRRALGWWRRAQRPGGGFGYASGGSVASQSTGSMTAAGIASLAILEAALSGHALGEGEEEGSPGDARARAVARLAQDFRIDHNFGPATGRAGQRQRNAGRGWLHYYLWSVERAMVLAGRERLADRDWYHEGARHLLATQKKDGSWRGEHPLYATCFAILFLARAADPPRAFTPPSVAPSCPVTPSPEDPSPAAPPPARDPPDVAETSALDALVAAHLAADPRHLLAVVQALDHRDREVRSRAAALLRRLLGDEVVGRADRHPLARGRLRLWLRRNAPHLVVEGDRFILPR